MVIIRVSTHQCGGNMLSLDNASEKPINASDWNQITPKYWKHIDLDDMDCFDMPSAWYIHPKDVEYLFSKGYEIYINNIKMEKATWQEEMERIKILRQEANLNRQQEANRKAQEKKQKQDDYDTKCKAMIGEMVQVNIPIYRDQIEIMKESWIELREEVGHLSADRLHHCVRFKSKLYNCEGIERFFDYYDMETYVYYLPKSIADQINEDQFKQAITNPSSYMVESVLAKQGIPNMTDHMKDDIRLNNSIIQNQIITNYKQHMLTFIPPSKQELNAITSEWSLDYNKRKGLDFSHEKITKVLGIFDQVITNQQLYNQDLDKFWTEKQDVLKALEIMKKAEIDRKFQEYNLKKTNLIAELQQLTKNQLIAKYPSIPFKPSWGKPKVIETIVQKEVKYP